MNKIKRLYNMYHKSIWKIVGVIVLVIIVLQVLNFITKQSYNVGNVVQDNEIVSNNETYNKVTIVDDKSQVTGTQMSDAQKTAINVIDDFYNYCNNNQIEEAYELLTDECKEQLYPTVNDFKMLYIDLIIKTGTADVKVENWVNSVYKITIMEDILATGIIGNGNVQEYVTIKNVEGEYKLNISGYVGKTEINKSNSLLGVEIEVIECNTYMDYETYTVQITNTNTETVILDTFTDITSMHIQDKNGVNYSAYTQELIQSDLTVDSSRSRILEIKYYSKYVSTKEIEALIFSDMILEGEKREMKVVI